METDKKDKIIIALIIGIVIVISRNFVSSKNNDELVFEKHSSSIEMKSNEDMKNTDDNKLNSESKNSIKKVHISGEINKPGAYTLTKSSTVIDAIGAAGSFNWDTAKKKIYLIHQDNPEKPIPINLNRILQTGDMSENYIMREGDILYLTKNSRINFARDIAPILTGAYMVSRIGKD